MTSATFGDGISIDEIPYACFNNTALKEVTIPASVTTIGDYAFHNSPNLTSVTFDDDSQLETIGNYGFGQCIVMESLLLPASLTSIGNYCFISCVALSDVRIYSEDLEGFGIYAFYNTADDLHVYVPPYSLSDYQEGWSWTVTTTEDDNTTETAYSYTDKLYPFKDSKITSACAATLALPFKSALPDGVTAYRLAYTGGTEVAGTQITADDDGTTATVDGDSPIYIEGDAATYSFLGTENSLSENSNSSTVQETNYSLVGVYSADGEYAPVNSYVLQNGSEGVKFYKVYDENTISVGQFRAYLVTADSGNEVSSISLDLTGENTTGIGNIATQSGGSSHSTGVYNLQGVRMNTSNMPDGVYIKDGRKFVVKNGRTI